MAWSTTAPDAIDFKPLTVVPLDTSMIVSLLARRGIRSNLEQFDGVDQVGFIYRDTRFFFRRYTRSDIRNYVELSAAWSTRDSWSDIEMLVRANRVNLHLELVRASYSPGRNIFEIEIALAASSLADLDAQFERYVNTIIKAAAEPVV